MALEQFDVKITFLYGKHLKGADLFNLYSDPYLIATVLPTLKYRTSYKQKTTNPIYNEEWQIAGITRNHSLYIECWDKDRGIDKDDFLGKTQANFDLLLPLGKNENQLELELDKKGVIGLKFNYIPRIDPLEKPISMTVQFMKHLNQMAGFILNNRNSNDEMAFCVYKIKLLYINDIFGHEKQHWNENYSKAKMIFSNPLIKTSLSTQHSALYASSITSQTGNLMNFDDFLQLIYYGQRPKGEFRFFTYVLLEDSLRFSETGAHFLKDMFSKHAMHSNCAEEVIYSGEFHIRQDENNQYRIVIDNNSGTYAPNSQLLPKLKQLLEMNFSDALVEIRDRKDPILLNYIDQCPSRRNVN